MSRADFHQAEKNLLNDGRYLVERIVVLISEMVLPSMASR
jgi:hypothetical protein